MKARRRRRYQKFMQGLVHEYMRNFKVEQVDLQEVAQWAVATGRWDEPPVDPVKRCKHDMARALAVEYTTDPQGREVRSMVAVPIVGSDNGQMLWEWAPIFSARPEHFKISQQMGRNAILADCRQHRLNGLSYNDNNKHGAVVDLFDYNFNPDLEEGDMPTEYPEEPPESSH